MGTTKTALQAGSLTYKWVLAIEGYPRLLTDAGTDLLATAWLGSLYDLGGGTGASQVGGLYVDLENELAINPFDPFGFGGKLTIRVPPDADDTLGIDVF